MIKRIGELNIDLLLALDAVLKDGNVTHAANRLNITQSALSGRLNRLRKILNDPLFLPAPSGRGVVVTPHALALKPQLEQVLNSLIQFAQGAHLFDPSSSERVFTIAASDNPAAIVAPRLISLVRAVAPSVRIAFVVPDKARIGELLDRGDIDLFIGSGDGARPDLVGRKLFEDELVTAQRVDHPRGNEPLSLDEFCSYEHLLISADGGMFSGVIDDILAEHGRKRRVAASIQSYSLAPLVVATTDLLCTLPQRLLERFPHSLELYPPPLALGKFEVWHFWHQKLAADPAHQWLRATVAEAANRGKCALS